MPELPDVEVMKRYLDATALHQKIETVEVHNTEMLQDVSAETLGSRLEGRTLDSTRRHGKWLFAATDEDPWLVLHFGMTGGLQYFKNLEKEPEYDRMLLCFANGYHLAYVAQRMLGVVSIIGDVGGFIEKQGLGPDALDSAFDLAAFKTTLGDRRGMVKSTLMNQEIVAGIGNVYADEMLFQAGIHPRTQFNQLDAEALERLYQEMKAVLQTAIEHQAKPDQFPDDFITPHRHADGQCPHCGAKLERVKVSGRSAYLCPNRQPKRAKS